MRKTILFLLTLSIASTVLAKDTPTFCGDRDVTVQSFADYLTVLDRFVEQTNAQCDEPKPKACIEELKKLAKGAEGNKDLCKNDEAQLCIIRMQSLEAFQMDMMSIKILLENGMSYEYLELSQGAQYLANAVEYPELAKARKKVTDAMHKLYRDNTLFFYIATSILGPMFEQIAKDNDMVLASMNSMLKDIAEMTGQEFEPIELDLSHIAMDCELEEQLSEQDQQLIVAAASTCTTDPELMVRVGSFLEKYAECPKQTLQQIR